MNKIEITVQKTARFFTIGPLNNPKRLYALHGYGQLANFFLQKFEPLLTLGWTVIAPEGLHRFYKHGYTGRVGASWMTGEDRLSDMADYVAYLNAVHKVLPIANGDLRILGFSQGVATAFRWLYNEPFPCSQMIMHSGMVPPEIELQTLKAGNCDYVYITGTQDPFRSEPEVETFVKKLDSFDTNICRYTFEGAHEIDIQSVISALNRF